MPSSKALWPTIATKPIHALPPPRNTERCWQPLC